MRSRITHRDVISVEIGEREGLYHNRGIITVTEQNKVQDIDTYTYYYEPIRVNTYRVAGDVVLRDIVFDEKVVEVYGREVVEHLIEEAKRIWRLQLPPIGKDDGEVYPDVEIILDFQGEVVKIDILVKYPRK